jgi:hypothetical protein
MCVQYWVSKNSHFCHILKLHILNDLGLTDWRVQGLRVYEPPEQSCLDRENSLALFCNEWGSNPIPYQARGSIAKIFECSYDLGRLVKLFREAFQEVESVRLSAQNKAICARVTLSLRGRPLLSISPNTYGLHT